MATSGFAESVDTVGTGIKDTAGYAKDQAEVVKKSIGETLSDPHFWSAMAVPVVVIGLAGAAVALLAHWRTVIELFKQPNVFRDALIALATVTLLLLIYVYLLKPEIRIGKLTRIDQLCPDRWAYDQKTKKCEPRYTTKCTAFSPKDPNLQSYRAQCDFAVSCGTDWAGVCS
jgi:hypothetical protein